jgi:hypothetical protein
LSKNEPKILVYDIVGNKTALRSIFNLFLELDPHSQYAAD